MRRLYWLLVALAASLPAHAQTEDEPIPRLGDHVFVPVTAMPEPFTTALFISRSAIARPRSCRRGRGQIAIAKPVKLARQFGSA